MKTIKFINENKMIIETGLRIFDNQTNLITTGSVFANTQKSMIIRSFKTVEAYNKHTHSEGYLQEYDLAFFNGDMPGFIKDHICKFAKERDVFVYEFFHINSSKVKTVHGYVITTKDHEFIEQFVIGPNNKSHLVIEECAQYVSDYQTKDYARRRLSVI